MPSAVRLNFSLIDAKKVAYYNVNVNERRILTSPANNPQEVFPIFVRDVPGLAAEITKYAEERKSTYPNEAAPNRYQAVVRIDIAQQYQCLRQQTTTTRVVTVNKVPRVQTISNPPTYTLVPRQ